MSRQSGKQQEDLEKQLARNEVRIAIDDVLTVYDNVPRVGCPMPAILNKSSRALRIIPTQTCVRGRSNSAVPALQTKRLDVLTWVATSDIVMVGLGHDPGMAQTVQTKVKQLEALKVFRWLPLVPIIQDRMKRSGQYLEYVLCGFGPDAPSTTTPPCFVHVKRGYPTTRLRPKLCDELAGSTRGPVVDS